MRCVPSGQTFTSQFGKLIGRAAQLQHVVHTNGSNMRHIECKDAKTPILSYDCINCF